MNSNQQIDSNYITQLINNHELTESYTPLLSNTVLAHVRDVDYFDGESPVFNNNQRGTEL